MTTYLIIDGSKVYFSINTEEFPIPMEPDEVRDMVKSEHGDELLKNVVYIDNGDEMAKCHSCKRLLTTDAEWYGQEPCYKCQGIETTVKHEEEESHDCVCIECGNIVDGYDSRSFTICDKCFDEMQKDYDDFWAQEAAYVAENGSDHVDYRNSVDGYYEVEWGYDNNSEHFFLSADA